MTHPDTPPPPNWTPKPRRPLQESGGLEFNMAFELPMVPEDQPELPTDPEEPNGPKD